MPNAGRSTATAGKARAKRLEMLQRMLDEHLSRPASALETLMKELHDGETREDLWEQLHASAARDKRERELADAYGKSTAPRRLKQLPQPERIAVLVHAADFFQGIVGDGETAGRYLRAVLAEVPGHPEAFARLERRLEALGDRMRLVELYADAVGTDAKDATAMAIAVVNNVARLPSEESLSDTTCQKLVPLVASSHAVIGMLEAQCKKTERYELMAALIAQALEQGVVRKQSVCELRKGLIDLYMKEAKQPAKALPFVAELLDLNPSDQGAKDAASRLLSVKEVASEAAAILSEARRRTRGE